MQAPVSVSGAEQVAAAADKAEAPVSLIGAEHLAAAGEEKQPSELLQGELTGHKEGFGWAEPTEQLVPAGQEMHSSRLLR